MLLSILFKGGVAAQPIIPRWVYLSAWGISGVAVGADILRKTWDAPKEKQMATAGYQLAFHIPASLVIPAVIIHRIVHGAQVGVERISFLKAMPSKTKSLIPVAVALLSVIPVVPAVDFAVEAALEPTLGSYLGLEFEHHYQDHDSHSKTE